MHHIKSRRGFTIAEILIAVSIAAIVMVTCVFGISSAIYTIRAVVEKSTADALAEAEAQYIKNEIRFAHDPDAVIESLSGHDASLNDMSVSGLIFETDPSGAVTFRFAIGEHEYEYMVIPLNKEFIQ